MIIQFSIVFIIGIVAGAAILPAVAKVFHKEVPMVPVELFEAEQQEALATYTVALGTGNNSLIKHAANDAHKVGLKIQADINDEPEPKELPTRPEVKKNSQNLSHKAKRGGLFG